MCVTFGECLGVTEMKYIYIYMCDLSHFTQNAANYRTQVSLEDSKSQAANQ